ncbi:2-C-methyl-D-erythritol 4-phosphate cytidylyltransferase IspD [Gottschalkia purinilytica]|uniref:2-C-methyl-D-erythritol 4-phosphate cytidylyltransferase n=1 Tax=Gottschalkia purinilytica TaxID=1503 RepID=A0A0L0W9L2_GOTPU|nr:2-C-methyl-D-erythritol 4-phosphate cytidylyltransferase [Gottschalkia purinilytica]KNF07990.1 2-C-methyl-D-erythritol 4-phosphate cytidylyltransferase IspD [Gottschalkia purinilytica]
MGLRNKYVSVIIVAAGMGKRMKSNINKQYILLKDKPILAYTIDRFDKSSLVDEIIVVTRKEEIAYCEKEIVKKYKFKKVTKIIAGGEERQNSVYNGLKETNKICDVVLIHDGVRPFIKNTDIKNNIEGAIEYGACVTGVPVKDTIKVVDEDNNIVDTPNRSKLWAVHTPQSFVYDMIMSAHEESIRRNIFATDDSMLVEKLGYKVKIIHGTYNNIKITTPEDLKFAETILDGDKEFSMKGGNY